MGSGSSIVFSPLFGFIVSALRFAMIKCETQCNHNQCIKEEVHKGLSEVILKRLKIITCENCQKLMHESIKLERS